MGSISVENAVCFDTLIQLEPQNSHLNSSLCLKCTVFP